MGPGQIIRNRINGDLIKIIQFCLKIYDLLRQTHLWMGAMGGWVDWDVQLPHVGQHGDNSGDNMRTMWRQHGVNVGTTGMWRPHGDNCGDNMGKT